MRILDLRGIDDPGEMGRKHGSYFAHDIASLAEIRIYLASKISGRGREELLAIADEHLSVLETFDAALYAELCGIAEGANLPASHIVVLNHYTDLRDLSTARGKAEADFDGGCTMFWGQSPEGPIFAQTWDMHASAIPFVVMLRVDGPSGNSAWVLSLTGCLGMAGFNTHGVAVGINNLVSLDAQVGVVWSALVRRCLHKTSAKDAKEVILEANVGSGHNYLMCDREDVFSIETSGKVKSVVFSGSGSSFVHANHCLDGKVGACSRVPEGSTTFSRQAHMEKALAQRSLQGLEDAFKRLGSVDGFPHSINTNCSTPENPHAAATCAGIAMSPVAGRLLCVSGFTYGAAPVELRLADGSQGDA